MILFRFQTPALLLAAGLQLLPLLRNIVTAPAATSSFAIILRWTIGSSAALGAVDAVSGATSAFTTPSTFNGTVGTPFSNNVTVSISGGNQAANNDYFILSSGATTSPLLYNGQSTTLTLPPGLTFKSSWVDGASTIGGVIYGTPTAAGSFPTAVTVVSPGNAQLSQNITISITGSVTPAAPAITSSPAAATVAAGQTAIFTVTASGTAPLAYYWMKGGTPLANGGNVSGANSATLTLTSVLATNAGNYSVTVSNSVGTATSAAAALTVIIPPAITSQPAGLSVTNGGSAPFAVTASGGTPLTYRWLKGGIGLTNGIKYSGANSSLLTVAALTAADAGNYSVIITNLAGSVTSTNAALTVLGPPVITTQPTNQTGAPGSSLVLAVAATGSGTLGYQWYKGTNALTESWNRSGSASNILTLSALTTNDAGGYSVVVTNIYGRTASSNALITVEYPATPPLIVTPPVSRTVALNSTVVLTVTASGTGPLAYQWLQKGGKIVNSATISGSTLSSLTLSNVTTKNSGSYSVIVTNLYGKATSAVATVSVLAPPLIVKSPASITGQIGGSATFTVKAKGAAPLHYQWFRNSIPLANGGNISGATLTTLKISALTVGDAGVYSVTITNLVGSATSANAILTLPGAALPISVHLPLTSLTAPPAPPVISEIHYNGVSGVTLRGTGAAGAVYILQATSELTDWSDIGTNSADANGQWQATDTNAAPCRFYRMKLAP